MTGGLGPTNTQYPYGYNQAGMGYWYPGGYPPQMQSQFVQAGMQGYAAYGQFGYQPGWVPFIVSAMATEADFFAQQGIWLRGRKEEKGEKYSNCSLFVIVFFFTQDGHAVAGRLAERSWPARRWSGRHVRAAYGGCGSCGGRCYATGRHGRLVSHAAIPGIKRAAEFC